LVVSLQIKLVVGVNRSISGVEGGSGGGGDGGGADDGGKS
jgi:hypothetical protein